MFRVVSVLFVEKQFWTKPEEFYVALLTMKSYQHFRVSKSWAKVGYFFLQIWEIDCDFFGFSSSYSTIDFPDYSKKSFALRH